VISEKGIVRVADGRMSDEERELLHNSAEVLRKAVEELVL
jgi:malate/lactate dehydrogenase